MVLTLGKDYDYVRNQVDIPRLNALNAYRSKQPPTDQSMYRVCLMLESFFGVSRHQDDQQQDEDDLMDDLMQFPQG